MQRAAGGRASAQDCHLPAPHHAQSCSQASSSFNFFIFWFLPSRHGEPVCRDWLAHVIFFGSLKEWVVFASHTRIEPSEPGVSTFLIALLCVNCIPTKESFTSPSQLDFFPPPHICWLKKQMKYFFYHQFPLFMYLPALIISEESYQRSNRLLKEWFGPQMINWGDNLIRVVCQRRIAWRALSWAHWRGWSWEHPPLPGQLRVPQTRHGSEEQALLRFWSSQIRYSAVLLVSLGFSKEQLWLMCSPGSAAPVWSIPCILHIVLTHLMLAPQISRDEDRNWWTRALEFNLDPSWRHPSDAKPWSEKRRICDTLKIARGRQGLGHTREFNWSGAILDWTAFLKGGLNNLYWQINPSPRCSCTCRTWSKQLPKLQEGFWD